jgi:hypothetical protein
MCPTNCSGIKLSKHVVKCTFERVALVPAFSRKNYHQDSPSFCVRSVDEIRVSLQLLLISAIVFQVQRIRRKLENSMKISIRLSDIELRSPASGQHIRNSQTRNRVVTEQISIKNISRISVACSVT